jgi:hypothetical protein
MNGKYINIIWVSRTLSTGVLEEISFLPGVNLMVGLPNTGKTKWLETIDYLLGDTGEAPYSEQGDENADLLEKYAEASMILTLAGERMHVTRKWNEPGIKSKVLVDGSSMAAADFQQEILQRLEIPAVNFPKGNPMSGQTWPSLSFRIMLRHMYRQQRFWSGLVDLQSDPEQHAALLQFLGIADKVFTNDYGKLIQLRIEAEKLRSRRDSYSSTLNELALDVFSEPELTVDVNEQTVRDAAERLQRKQDELLRARTEVLASGLAGLEKNNRSMVESLTEKRVGLVSEIESLGSRQSQAEDRFKEIRSYAKSLQDELDRLQRAEDAGGVLADLKVTHCPACDQSVSTDAQHQHGDCFLCHQPVPIGIDTDELGSLRIKYEKGRIESEQREAQELLSSLHEELTGLQTTRNLISDEIRALDLRLAPARQSLSPLIQDSVSSIDMELGEFAERQRHLTKLGDAVDAGRRLSERIQALENEMEPLKKSVEAATESADFDGAASKLADGMNAYLSAVNALRPKTWKHSRVNVLLNRSSFSVRVGSKKWRAALGGTDSLYLLMAYHYGLLALSTRKECNFPGLVIIDFPGEFAGESVKDIDNFVVQPFIDLSNRADMAGTQVIITGPSFAGLEVAHRELFEHVYIAK